MKKHIYMKENLWLSDRTLQCPFDRWRAKPQRLRILPRLDQVSNYRPTPQ